MFIYVRYVFIWFSFEKLKSDYNQTKIKYAIRVPSVVMSSKVTYQEHGSSEVN